MRFFIMFLNCIVFIVNFTHAQNGYFCVPVTDLVAKPFVPTDHQSINALYNELAISPQHGKSSCLRLHQGIFNEKVTILAYEHQQVQVELCNCFFQSMPAQKLQRTRFWTRSDWVISEQELTQLKISQAIFPPAIQYNDFCRNDFECVSLVVPWYDTNTDTTYSAGTRFVEIPPMSTEQEFAIRLYNHHTQQATTSHVPRSVALTACFSTPHEQKQAFVELLYIWCSLDGLIPFVWGGTSFNYMCKDEYAVLQEEYCHGKTSAFWHRPYIIERPYAGFDASGFILRAAQIVGAPFFCINSTTIGNYLRPLRKNESLEEGDILWSPGYVGVVGSFKNNELIEMQGYARGYGKLHAIPLQKRFANIYSWDDFLDYYWHSLSLQSLDIEGNIVGLNAKYILFKFP